MGFEIVSVYEDLSKECRFSVHGGQDNEALLNQKIAEGLVTIDDVQKTLNGPPFMSKCRTLLVECSTNLEDKGLESELANEIKENIRPYMKKSYFKD